MFDDRVFGDMVAVVTGGGSGIGLAIAHSLVGHGAYAVLVGRRAEVLQRAVDSLGAASAEAAPGDVRDRDRVQDIADNAIARHGGVHLLVNSAGATFRAAPEDLSPNAWASVVRIVLDGTWNWSQVLGQAAITAGQPMSILNIGTAAASTGSATAVHSASAKAGVLTMTRSLAAAWGRYGIRVNALTPGATRGTHGLDVLYPSGPVRQQHEAEIPMGRFGAAEEVARSAAFLLSGHAAYVTGANLVVDGGRSIAATAAAR